MPCGPASHARDWAHARSTVAEVEAFAAVELVGVVFPVEATVASFAVTAVLARTHVTDLVAGAAQQPSLPVLVRQ